MADENIHAHPLMVATWRRRTRSGGVVLRAGGSESALLERVAAAGDAGVAPDDVAAMLGLSRQRAAGLITRLAAIGLLDFRYLGGSFRLVAPD